MVQAGAISIQRHVCQPCIARTFKYKQTTTSSVNDTSTVASSAVQGQSTRRGLRFGNKHARLTTSFAICSMAGRHTGNSSQVKSSWWGRNTAAWRLMTAARDMPPGDRAPSWLRPLPQRVPTHLGMDPSSHPPSSKTPGLPTARLLLSTHTTPLHPTRVQASVGSLTLTPWMECQPGNTWPALPLHPIAFSSWLMDYTQTHDRLSMPPYCEVAL